MVSLQRAVQVTGPNIGRSLRKRYTEASEPSWQEVGQTFHTKFRPNRFTEAHAIEAGYKARKLRYLKQKFRKFGHRNPLEYSGETKALVRTAHIKARKGTGAEGNRGGVKITYRGARKLNLRSKHSDINMADEFRRVTLRESMLLGIDYQTRFEARFYKG